MKMNNEIKDTLDFISVNMGGIGLSLTSIDGFLRTFILLATLIYSVQKIMYYKKNK